MEILVAGASGFIGRRATRCILDPIVIHVLWSALMITLLPR